MDIRFYSMSSCMRQASSSEQQKYFLKEGYIEFEELILKEQAAEALQLIKESLRNLPGYPAQQLFKTVPFLLQLIKKRGLASFAFEALRKKPLRLLQDQFFSTPPSRISLERGECGLLLYLNSEKSGHGLYFLNDLPMQEVKGEGASAYLLFVFSDKNLGLQPIVLS
jgi:hypothetical protein